MLELRVRRHILPYISMPPSDGDVPAGALLRQADKDAGRVTSVARHPLTGEAIGLAIVRGAFAKTGTELEAADAQGERLGTAKVRELPERVGAGA